MKKDTKIFVIIAIIIAGLLGSNEAVRYSKISKIDSIVKKSEAEGGFAGKLAFGMGEKAKEVVYNKYWWLW